MLYTRPAHSVLRVCRDEWHVLLQMNIAPLSGTVTKILNDLKWLTIEKRRKVVRFKTMFKVVSGLSATQFPPYILFKRRQGTRQSHLKKFIQVDAKTNKYQHSFIARTIRDWNSLPSSVIEKQSVEAFKKTVMCHL